MMCRTIKHHMPFRIHLVNSSCACLYYIYQFIYLFGSYIWCIRSTLINKIIKMNNGWILFKAQFSIMLPTYFVTSILKCIYLYAYIFSCGMFGSLYGKQIYKVFLRLGITYNLKVSHFLSKPRWMILVNVPTKTLKLTTLKSGV